MSKPHTAYNTKVSGAKLVRQSKIANNSLLSIVPFRYRYYVMSVVCRQLETWERDNYDNNREKALGVNKDFWGEQFSVLLNYLYKQGIPQPVCFQTCFNVIK